jgi:hydroxymethylbilane synthase
MRTLTAGTRGSELALAQTQLVVDNLQCNTDVKIIKTRGDKIYDVPLARLEGKGFFTKEIDEALMNEEIDLAVHSMKDVPTELVDGITVAAIPVRESPCDALMGEYSSLKVVPSEARVGTSSLRRASIVRRLRPDCQVLDLRGNVGTRIKKLHDGDYEAIIVAEAGLKRLGIEGYFPLDPEEFIPAPSQGGLAITCRSDDSELINILSELNHPMSRITCEAERAFLTTLGGGCQIPAGIYTRLRENSIDFYGFVSSLDGRDYVNDNVNGELNNANALCIELANNILSNGGKTIIESVRKES